MVHVGTDELPVGHLHAELRLTVRGHIPGLSAASVQVVVVKDGTETVVHKVFGRRTILQLRHPLILLEFENASEGSRYDFHVFVTGKPYTGVVQFSGLTVHQVAVAANPRFKRAELHVGEKLSLLVALIHERTSDLYRPLLPETGARGTEFAAGPPGERLQIAVAPFSNSEVRNWPPQHYAELIRSVLDRFPCDVTMLGTPDQASDARAIAELVRSPHLIDMVGRTSWADLQTVLRESDLVICNNSGTAHLAAAIGARVLAIYSGSHPPREWGPRGIRSVSLMRPMSCSPCGYERLKDCPYDHECMRSLTPVQVFAEVHDILAETRETESSVSVD